ncbi:sugar transferase, partial [bacterium]|nr:sugar transferase [bacterium]
FNVTRATLVGVFIIFLVTIDLRKPLSPSRVVLMSYWGFIIFFSSLGRILIRRAQQRLLRQGIGLRNALIIGFNERARTFLQQAQRAPDMGLRILGFVNGSAADEYLGVKVISDLNRLEETITTREIKQVILAPSPQERDTIPGIISRLANMRISVKVLPDMTETLYGHLRTAQVRGVPLIDVFPDILSPWERTFKRFIDIMFALVVLIIGFPFFVFIGICIKLDSPGPVLYSQQRVGRGGKVFTLFKFRSMMQNAEAKTGPVWAGKEDPRITRVGKIIRRLRIDEFPQFFNVLKGDMALVGPRPERAAFVDEFRSSIPLYERRLNVKPGITGWAQVKHKYDESLTDVKEKLRYDLFYLENMSLALDIKIILSTFGVVLRGKGQ